MVSRAVTVAVPAVALTAIAWWSGGYFPRTWGALLLAAAIGLAFAGIIAEHVEVGWRTAALVGALLALVGWQIVTTAWAVDPDAPTLEAERTLLYAAVALLTLLAVPARRASDLVLSVLVGAGAATVTGLLAHTLGAGTPDDRLELPVGYANASGIVAAITLLLGLGFATSPLRLGRALGAALAPPAAVALALSLSRGSLLAAALGVLVLGASSRSRRDLATIALVAAPAALAVVASSLAGGLEDEGAAPRELLALLAIAGVTAASAWFAAVRGPASTRGRATARWSPARTALVVACAVGAVAVLGVAVYEVGQSRSTPTSLEGTNRLLSTSTSSRGDYWHVAADMVADHPFGGDGAGGFGRVWLAERPALLFVRDAHNLYLETLAELGPLGLALLVVALGTPLVGMRRAGASAQGRAALAAYAAFLAHAALDWDWELPSVTVCALLLAVALVRLGPTEPARRLTTAARTAILAAATVLGAVAIAIHAGNGATADANDLLDRGDAAAARRAAVRAQSFRPWAAEPWELIGQAELAEGRAADARAHLRRALREDPRSWSAWLSLAVASAGPERTLAIARARSLNPLAPEVEALTGSGHP